MRRIRLARFTPLLIGVYACSGDVGGQPAPGSDPSGVNALPGNGDTTTGLPGGSSASTDGPSAAAPNAQSAPGMSAPGMSAAGTTATTDAVPLAMVLDGQPMYSRVVRLTHGQWENSTRYLLQVESTNQQQNLAEDVSGVYDFSNHEALLFMNANLYRDYQMAAEELAAAIGPDDAAINAIYPGQDAQGFIQTVGRRAFRRPLTPQEVQALQELYDTGAELTEHGNTPHARGAALVLEALLQSPYFLYRTEVAEPGARLSGYEIAAKLSLLLLGVTPNDALLDAAANGQLDTDDGVRDMAMQMLNDPGASDAMKQFHGEILRFDNYLNIIKDPEDVPEFTPELNEELEEAAYLFFDRIFKQSLGVSDILTSTIDYVGPAMAPFYGVQVSGPGLQEMDLGPQRPGFFTHLPFLILNSQNQIPDPIHRGVSLNLKVLCGRLAPPGMVDTTLPAFEPGMTNRERITAGSGPGTCGAACHGPYINPLGFAFENFDGLGRLRETDNGSPVDTQAEYPFKEGTKSFSGAPELMQIMAEGEQAHACYSKHLASFGLQRDLNAGDQDLVDALTAESRAGASIKDLVVALVSNPAFTTRAIGGAQ